jgi:hypothetical protein
MILVELYALRIGSVVFMARMAADERSSLNPQKLGEVLAKLNDVLAEAARLRKEIIRQLSDQRAAQQQHLTVPRKRKKRAKPKTDPA